MRLRTRFSLSQLHDKLGVMGTPEDIPLLRTITLEASFPVASNAVLAIRRIGGENARAALVDLERKVSDAELKVRIREALKQ